MKYFWNILIAIDQLLNAILFGDPDETLSSRIGKKKNCKLCIIICKALDFLDKNHCQESIEDDEGDDEIL